MAPPQAQALAAAGAAPVVNYVSSKQGADDVVAGIKADGGRAIAVKADIAKVAVFLAFNDAGWITGERVVVSGGLR